jgi:excisionase family DNA binding protein
MKRHQVAAFLGVSEDTVDRERQRGRLKWVQVGRQVRFHDHDVSDYLATVGTLILVGANRTHLRLSHDEFFDAWATAEDSNREVSRRPTNRPKRLFSPEQAHQFASDLESGRDRLLDVTPRRVREIVEFARASGGFQVIGA